MSQSPAAPPIASLLGTRPGFSELIDGFRGRLDGEIAAFLGAKRVAAQQAAPHAAAASPGPTAFAGPAAPRAGAARLLADPADLVEGVARLIAQGGKRIRPALVYFTYRACGGRFDEQVLPLALATELLHTYLLIHDDIMDHAELRRGQPAAHARFRALHRGAGLRGDGEDFGRSVAILLGDLAHTYAVELFTTAASAAAAGAARPEGEALPAAAGDTAPAAAAAAGAAFAPRRQWAELNRCFSAMCEEVIGGQYLELLLAHRPWEPAAAEAGAGDARRAGEVGDLGGLGEAAGAAREAELLRILRLKSGRYTAERPIQLGALLAGAPPDLRAELSRYGAAVGEAFQLQDDLLGVFGDPATVGKPVGDDIREGKFTLLIHHALAGGTAGDRQLLAAALGKPDLTAGEVARVQEVIERTGARRAVTAMVAERLNAARRALDAVIAVIALATTTPLAAPSRGSSNPATPGAPGKASAAQATPETAEGLRFLAGLLEDLWEREH